MSISNILGFDGKLLPSVFPAVSPYPPVATGLGAVLAVSGAGNSLPMTNVGSIGCSNIAAPFGSILAFGSDLITNGATNNLGILPVGNLTLAGCQTKGSMLVGDGTSSKELIVPVAPALPDGSVLILDSTTSLGVRWGGEAGDINSITPGTNIDITGPTANPIVALKAPLTSTLNMGAVAITDSAGAVGVSGQVLTAGTGGQTLWGSNGVASITPGSNIGVAGTASVPVVSLLSPLTSTLNVGTQNVQGTTSQITLTNGGSQAVQQATTGFTSIDSTIATTKANVFKTSISIETNADKVSIQPTSILKTLGTTALSVGSVGSAPLNLFGAGGNANGITLAQIANVGTVLQTNLSNVKFYPDTLINNNNLNTVGVPLPQVDYQRLTLTNLGLTNTNVWADYGSAVFSGYTAFGRDSNGFIWLADATGSIQVWDSTITTLQFSLAVSGGTNTVNVFYLQGGYMWIGGNFTTVADGNGVNATPQYSITRVDIATNLFDPINDGAVFGVQIGYDVFAIHDINGVLGIGGNFNTKSNGATPFSNIAEITNPYAIGGSQFYNEFQGGADNTVYAIYNDSTQGRTYIGGGFLNVGISTSPTPLNYCGYYDATFVGWFQVANNQLNNQVFTIKPTSYSQILLTGAFTTSMGISFDYSIYLDNTTPNTFIDTNFNMGGVLPDYRQGFYNGSYNTLIGFDNTFYISNVSGVWTSLGQCGAGALITGIDDWNGSYKVIGNTYQYVRSHSVLPHSCIFTGSFVYDGTAYGNYTIVPRNVSQQFIGDDANSFWSIIGAGVGTFS